MCVTRYAIARPPVCPSPVLADTRFDHSKTVEVSIMKFSPYLAPSLWLLRGEFHPEILTGSHPIKQGIAGETSHFLAVNVNMSQTVEDSSKLLLMPSRICAFD